MTTPPDDQVLIKCYQSLAGHHPTSIVALKPHASDRRIYRLLDRESSLVGVVNDNQPENAAFVYLARYFTDEGLPVPKVHYFSSEENVYLVDDLGDQTLLGYLELTRAGCKDPFPALAEKAYEQVLSHLAQFQISAGRNIDFSRCYPESCFSASALMADMKNFSSELVSRLIPDFDATRLLPEYEALVKFLAEADHSYFLYRDFQSRNVMMIKDHPHYIDFQGGRQGPLQYDVVSLLYQSSAQLPQVARDRLLHHYMDCAAKLCLFNHEDFFRRYGGFIISRMLQVLGVYGRQGLGAGKEYFTASIPEALRTLRLHLSSATLPKRFTALEECADRLLEAGATR